MAPLDLLLLSDLAQSSEQLLQRALADPGPLTLALVFAGGALTSLGPCSLSLLPVTLAYLAGFVLQQLFNFRRAEHVGAKTFGMILAVFTMHMVVHAAPAPFEFLFSEAWVHQVIRITDPTTIAVF